MQHRHQSSFRTTPARMAHLQHILIGQRRSLTAWVNTKILEEICMDDIRCGYKVLTHDYCSPLQGGTPIWDGRCLPYELPAVTLDTSNDECAGGWNYCATLPDALLIAGLWPNGYPSIAFEVIASSDAVARGTKRRASRLTLVRQLDEEEILSGITSFSACFAPYVEVIVEEQRLWRSALRRPASHEGRVAEALVLSLEAKGLQWILQKFETTMAAWAAISAWDSISAWRAWTAFPSSHAWAAISSRHAISAWAAISSRHAWDTISAWAAMDAVTYFVAVTHGWLNNTGMSPHQRTTGIRDAYAAGLGIALPVAPGVLGWAMETPSAVDARAEAQ